MDDWMYGFIGGFVITLVIAVIKDFHTARSLAKQRAKETIEKRKNLEDRLVLLQAKLIEIEDWTVADESI